MKLKNRLHLALLLILTLPVFTVIVSSFFLFMSWYAAIEEADDIEAPRFIRPVMKEILDGTIDEEFHGVILVLDHNAELLYLAPPVEEYLQEEWDWDDLNSEEFYKMMMEEMPPDQPFSFSIYRYHGKAGVVMYMQEDFFKIRMSQVLWVILFFFYLGFILLPALSLNLMIRPMMRSLLRMEKAAQEIGRGNLDFTIIETNCRKKKHKGGLNKLETAMENMRLELKENHERNSRIIMSISHDLKTPLTSIKGYVEAIEDGMAKTPEEMKQYTSIIQEKAEILEERISELIHFSKLRTTDWQSRFEWIPLESFLKDCGDIFHSDALLSGRTFTTSLELTEEHQILGDSKLLFQVMENLFDNGCRYTDRGDSLTLKAWQEADKVYISMEDSGKGIPEQHRDKIFETFYRADPGRNSPGLGIGLASARAIIDSHGGSIEYRQSELGGAAFVIGLPFNV